MTKEEQEGILGMTNEIQEEGILNNKAFLLDSKWR